MKDADRHSDWESECRMQNELSFGLIKTKEVLRQTQFDVLERLEWTAYVGSLETASERLADHVHTDGRKHCGGK